MKALRTFTRRGMTYFAGQEVAPDSLPASAIPLLVKEGWIDEPIVIEPVIAEVAKPVVHRKPKENK